MVKHNLQTVLNLNKKFLSLFGYKNVQHYTENRIGIHYGTKNTEYDLNSLGEDFLKRPC